MFKLNDEVFFQEEIAIVVNILNPGIYEIRLDNGSIVEVWEDELS